MMKWSRLLSAERLGGRLDPVNHISDKNYPRTEFQKDYQRIIACASFRRLQDKTQVFPLDQSDFVRTRLTHSYETAALAKTLGVMLQTVLKNVISYKHVVLDDRDKESTEHIPDILSCAGLLHDIGNPPFGHFGEEVIKSWFTSSLKNYTLLPAGAVGEEKSLEELLTDRHKSDLAHFDGNAQALRVLTKLHFQDSDWGLNLTCGVLNTLVKYPTPSDRVKGKASPEDLLAKKMGYTQEDQAVYERITETTGAKGCRHPLAFALEAADDAAYKTADLEDGYKKGLFTLDELLQFADGWLDEFSKKNPGNKTIHFAQELFDQLKILRQEGRAEKFQKKINDPDLYAIQNWVPYAQEWLLYCAAYGFERNYHAIMKGAHNQELLHGTNHGESVELINSIMEEFVYGDRGIVKLELAANTILSNLLDKFTRAVLFHDKKEYRSQNCVELQAYKKLYHLISDNYREACRLSLSRFKEQNPGADEKTLMKQDLYLRLLLVADYISGMTDSYAKSLYQELGGIYGLGGIY